MKFYLFLSIIFVINFLFNKKIELIFYITKKIYKNNKNYYILKKS